MVPHTKGSQPPGHRPVPDHTAEGECNAPHPKMMGTTALYKSVVVKEDSILNTNKILLKPSKKDETDLLCTDIKRHKKFQDSMYR